MKTAGQLLVEKQNIGIHSVPPDASIYAALELMAAQDIGAVLVIDEGSMVGIFSERDYARKIVLKGKNSTDTRMYEVMTQKIFYVSPHNTMDECMHIMSQKRIRHLPVLEQGEVLGVLSITDMVRETIAEQQFVIEQLEKYISQ